MGTLNHVDFDGTENGSKMNAQRFEETVYDGGDISLRSEDMNVCTALGEGKSGTAYAHIRDEHGYILLSCTTYPSIALANTVARQIAETLAALSAREEGK